MKQNKKLDEFDSFFYFFLLVALATIDVLFYKKKTKLILWNACQK